MLQYIALGAASFLLIFSAGTDIYSRRIYNSASFCIFFLAILVAHGRGDLTEEMVAVILIFPFLYTLWILRIFGGGDVKFILAVIPLVPLCRLVSMFLSISVAGIFVALCCLAVSRLGKWDQKYSVSLSGVSALRVKSPVSVPYGVAIAMGVLVETFRDQGMQ
ncbi:A24 family peptidase [Acetobacter sp.]|jgi:prepilin peptidase CpaA|uniref:A24 family peptidase n=1 Tax=Acetobacter sp. TaxID=440 RepID=UPI0025BDCC25|nr:A24 family peptidase [Acetobacter sp.]MCH4090136.1 A24 family peptidase [Acetobacter sp.]MCI1298831.1 A24 family peptidase [Acetobacter sp.]MCI1314851.1 A24 family peptidase [Acetobacter sp.]